MRKKKNGKKGLRAVLAAAALTVAAGIIILVWLAGRPPAPPAPEKAREVALYFSDEEGLYLKAEKRKIGEGPLAVEARAALDELMKGPVNAAFANPLPEGTRLLGLGIDGQTATVDFSRELIQNHPGGSSGETQTVYSIVNTLTLNFPQIKEVQILVEGRKEDTIAGHIDVTLPLGPDTKLIKS